MMGITAFIILIIQNSREDIREKENGRKLYHGKIFDSVTLSIK